MIKNSRKQKTESGTNAAASACALPQHPASSIQHPAPIRHSSFVSRHSRPGLTLIELLVTIVIMVTVLAGVLPLVSPNNNSRKLREASRQLNSLLSQAQAQAARDGRPVGVAFRETGTAAPYSGMALEAYMIAEPQPFAGFSEHSRVTVVRPPDEKLTYGLQEGGNATGNLGTMFDPRYRGFPIWQLIFWLYESEDLVPPRMLRNGDTINVDGNYFLIVDDPGNSEGAHQVDEETGFVVPTSRMFAIWLNNDGQQLAIGARKTYSFARQPMNTSEQPLQFPRGIGIDMEGSGATGIGGSIDFDVSGATTVGIMFSPNGSIDTVYRDGRRLDGVEQIYLLLGLFENGNNSDTFSEGYDFMNFQVTDSAELASRRGLINWLHADSRWVSVNRAGRIITAENNVSFDPSSDVFLDPLRKAENPIRAQRDAQLGAARNLAQQMSGSTGR